MCVIGMDNRSTENDEIRISYKQKSLSESDFVSGTLIYFHFLLYLELCIFLVARYLIHSLFFVSKCEIKTN